MKLQEQKFYLIIWHNYDLTLFDANRNTIYISPLQCMCRSGKGNLHREIGAPKIIHTEGNKTVLTRLQQKFQLTINYINQNRWLADYVRETGILTKK